jgi:hypothetical protein
MPDAAVPIRLQIERGRMLGARGCSPDIQQVLAAIRADEGRNSGPHHVDTFVVASRVLLGPRSPSASGAE